MLLDYVRWMGIAAWCAGKEIPYHAKTLSFAPGDEPKHVNIELVGGSAHGLPNIERQYTHIQWLLAGAPRDEDAVEYVYTQALRFASAPASDAAFAVLDLRDPTDGTKRDYSPAQAVRFAQQVQDALVGHVPQWTLAEPLGLLALAIREYFTNTEIRRCTQAFAQNHSQPQQAGVCCAVGRLAYSVATLPADATELRIKLHVTEGDPLFTPATVQHLITRAQDFADACGSDVDCSAIFHDLQIHSVFPATVHEPDALEIPIDFFRIPLAVELLTAYLPQDSLPENAEQAVLTLHRNPASGVITAQNFIPGTTLIDRSVQQGGYLATSEVLMQLRQTGAAGISTGLASFATAQILWESLATWGLSKDAWKTGDSAVCSVTASHAAVQGDSISRPLMRLAVRKHTSLASVFHDACDVLAALGVDTATTFPIEITWSDQSDGSHPQQIQLMREPAPCLWTRALGARNLAATDQALALAVARQALANTMGGAVEWIGMLCEMQPIPGPWVVQIALLPRTPGSTLNPTHFRLALTAACNRFLPGAQISWQFVDATTITDHDAWITVLGCHPTEGVLPAYMQLERLLTGLRTPI